MVRASLVLLITSFAFACADDGGGSDPQDDASAALYSSNCAGCHGGDGEGGIGDFPALTAVVPPMSVTQIESSIRDGVGDDMPAFTEAQITDSELTPLAEWVKGEFGG